MDLLPYVPFLTSLLLYCLIGTTGNILILVVYFRERVKLSHVLFIRVLSLVDLTVCVVIIPYTIAFELHVIKVDFICRFIELLRHVLVLYSNGILSAIALERYFAVCRPMRKLSYRQLHVVISALLVIVILISLPATVIFRVCRLTDCHSDVTELYGDDVIGTNGSVKLDTYCQFSTLTLGSLGTNIYQAFQCVFFFLAVLSFLIIYPLVYRVIVKRSFWRRTRIGAINLDDLENSVSKITAPSKTTPDDNPSRNKGQNKTHLLTTPTQDNASTSKHLQVTPSPTYLQVTTQTKANTQVGRRRVRSKTHTGSRTGTMLFVCTLVFVLVWMPFWIDVFTSVENLTFRYLFLIGHVTNPLIYGIMSKEVRRDICSLFTCRSR